MRFASHGGLGATRIPVTRRAVYLGQSDGSSTTTGTRSMRSARCAGTSIGGGITGFPVSSAASRATPRIER